jgi:manganese/iron transport system ATP-binding protein/manganese/zinc/iron transport system ATP- binding protein
VSDRPLIEVSGLAGGYAPGADAISGVGFALERGQTLAVLGPNGGGKTTLFRALLGELPRTSGRVRAPSIAYVPQTERSRLDFPVSALDVALMGTYGSVPWYRRLGRTQRGAAAAALERVGLADRARVRFGELSGGQRQRVLIARALAQGAEALLLDEPLSGVDQPSAERILRVLAELRDEGRAIVLSTHDIDQARAFDRVLCLNRSQVYFGPPEELGAEDLARTYGSELIVLDGGERAIVVQHHDHDH